jgi:hypothetical protein
MNPLASISATIPKATDETAMALRRGWRNKLRTANHGIPQIDLILWMTRHWIDNRGKHDGFSKSCGSFESVNRPGIGVNSFGLRQWKLRPC